MLRCQFTSDCKGCSDVLSVKASDDITVVKWDVNDQWALGMLGGKKGLFYKGFCKRLLKQQAKADACMSPISRSGTMVTFEGQEYVVCKGNPEDWYSCIICHQLALQPTQTLCCAQTFCQLCIQRWRQTSNACPQCRKATTRTTPDPRLERQILSLAVYCPNYIHGCEWSGELRSMEDHSRECECAMETCPNEGCGKKVFAKLLTDHTEQHCPQRQVECPFCKQSTITDQPHTSPPLQHKAPINQPSKFAVVSMAPPLFPQPARAVPPPPPLTFKELCETHHSSCTKWPVYCPNACEEQCALDRSTLQKHLDDNCPIAVVPCVFRDEGCKEKVPRKDMQQHVEEKMATHLMMLHKGFEKLKQENEELKRMLSNRGYDNMSLVPSYD